MLELSPLVLLMFLAYLLAVLAVVTLWFILTLRAPPEGQPGRAERPKRALARPKSNDEAPEHGASMQALAPGRAQREAEHDARTRHKTKPDL